MRFLIDADLPRETAALVTGFGHDAVDVRDVGMASAPDTAIAQRAVAEGRAILTADGGFADIRNYPPERFAGIVVVELPADARKALILTVIRAFLSRPDLVQELSGRLAIIEPMRARFRPPLEPRTPSP